MDELSKEMKIEVINFVTSKTEIRSSELQRKFLWGYNRAYKTMIWLQHLGVVYESKGLVGRKVLMTSESAKGLFKYLR